MKCIKSWWKQKDVIHLNFYPHVSFESEHSMWVKIDSAALGELCGKQLASGFPTWSTYDIWWIFMGFSTSDHPRNPRRAALFLHHRDVTAPCQIPSRIAGPRTYLAKWSTRKTTRLERLERLEASRSHPIPLFAAQTPVFVVLPPHFLWWIVPLFEWFGQCWVGRRYHHTFVRRAMTWTVGIKLHDMTDMAYQNLVGDWTTLMKATCLPLWICWIVPTQTKRFLLAPTINLFWGTRNHCAFFCCQAATLGNLKYDWHAKLPQSWSQHRYTSATSSHSASPQSHRWRAISQQINSKTSRKSPEMSQRSHP